MFCTYSLHLHGLLSDMNQTFLEFGDLYRLFLLNPFGFTTESLCLFPIESYWFYNRLVMSFSY